MIAGFTGTQEGMTDNQKAALVGMLDNFPFKELHHGDCIGSDDEAHTIAHFIGLRIEIHPPDNSSKQARCVPFDKIYPPKPYLQRNHDIVDACDHLFAAPKENKEVLRSGTWSTIRYARKVDKPYTILWP